MIVIKKIVVAIPQITGFGGTETVIRQVANLFNDHSEEYTMQLLLLGGSDDESWLEGIPFQSKLIKTDSKIIRYVIKFSSLFNYLKKEKPDVFISIDSGITRACNFCRKVLKHKFPIVSWIHFSLNAEYVSKELLLYADYHLAISEGIKRQFLDMGVQDSRIKLIYNPINYTKEIIPRPHHITRFLYIGRIWFEGQKRLKDLLTALSQVKGKWKLDVYGSGEDLEICKQFAKETNISEKIVWHGWVPKPWKEIDEATAMVLTSAYEGLPMVLAEAISRGVYCISSNCETGPSDIIKENINGQLYELNDLESLRNILNNIVNGQKLPDQEGMKNSIKALYLDQYFQSYKSAINDILEEWYN